MGEQVVGLDLVEGQGNTWTVSVDGPNQNRMRERLSGLDPATRAKIFFTASRILSQCPAPEPGEARVTGLALGKVQSGKTSSFIALTAQAFDNGYRVIVVLAGTKKNLLQQTTSRIEEDLSEGRERELTVLSTGQGTFRPQDAARLISLGRPVVITVLKHHKHLSQVTAMFRVPDLANLPVLIIDDEGDQASLNTQKRPKVGATYRAIGDLRNILAHHAYVAYTATPQANLLLDTLDDLTPDFCVLVEPGPGYTGGTVFHGSTAEAYVRPVPSEGDSDLEDGMQDSLEKALAIFFVGAVIRHRRDPDADHSMLVHTSHRQTDHGGSRMKVEALVHEWLGRLDLPDGDPSKQSLLKRFKEGYDDLTKTVAGVPQWEEISTCIRDEVLNSTPIIVNSSKEGQRPDSRKKMPFRNNIFIGGNMLDRGVTIPGLAVTFITRWSKDNNADTVEQRARWFGYKQSYLDVCRVWAPKEVLEGFSSLLGHEDEFWHDLRMLAEEKRNVKDWRPRLLVLNNASLRPTRRSVASYILEEQHDWRTQLQPNLAADESTANLHIVQEFFNGRQAQSVNFGIQTHLLVPDVPRVDVQTELLNLLRQSDPAWTGEAIRAWLNKIDDNVNVEVFDVIWIQRDSGGLRTRSLVGEGKRVDGLLQGRSGAHRSSYPGDKQLRPGRPQIQVHTPMVRNIDGSDLHQAVLLAIHVPGLTDAGIRMWRNHE